MAALQNIGADNAGDSFYRYKMPILQAKIEGRGNGIKTNVVNNVDIAKALDRPPAYIIKFFGCELGALTSYDVKTGMSIVNGAHDSKRLAELLDSFIKKYVQCHSCGNPETRIKIKRENIYLVCKACGAPSCVDMRHKVNNYILKNPPEEKLSKEEKKLKKQEKERLKGTQELKASKSGKEKGKDKDDKKAKKRDKKKGKADEEKVDEKGNEGESSAPQSDDCKKPEDVEEVENEGDDDEHEEHVVWHTDTSDGAMKKRAEEQLTQGAAALIVQGNVEAEREAANKVEKKALAKLGLKPEEVTAMFEIRDLIDEDGPVDAVAAKLKDTSAKAAVRMQLLFIALIGHTEKPLGSLLKEKHALLKSVATSNKDQLAQLIALEYFMGVVAPQHVKESSKVLNVLYELKVIDEDLIIAWYDRPSAGTTTLGVPEEAGQLVRKHAHAFVKWLKEAEEEEEDDDEEEDEDEEEEDDN